MFCVGHRIFTGLSESDCLKNTCDECANGQQISESAIDQDVDLTVTVKRWQKGFSGETVVCHDTLMSIMEVSEAFQTLLPQFQLQHLLKRNQQAMYRKDKERATSERILLHFDFSENATCPYENEV